ncbi:hypothetical protein THIOM_005477 [Candidatus Thiomargarita nelsonii]|uniref:Uncharacterized protein n=1 Tax=Candidatus Thiomargarita nelsonii TaxID=1003181 RepID=A0A176RT77_9GAMM|nr:hypothetical protein THIOM_005477 [Candidatus Thiomargarita nelsonii]
MKNKVCLRFKTKNVTDGIANPVQLIVFISCFVHYAERISRNPRLTRCLISCFVHYADFPKPSAKTNTLP